MADPARRLRAITQHLATQPRASAAVSRRLVPQPQPSAAAAEQLSLGSTVVLRSGVRMPLFGLGTAVGDGPGSGGTRCLDACAAALDCGYRLLDTAALYDNEAEVSHHRYHSPSPQINRH